MKAYQARQAIMSGKASAVFYTIDGDAKPISAPYRSACESLGVTTVSYTGSVLGLLELAVWGQYSGQVFNSEDMTGKANDNALCFCLDVENNPTADSDLLFCCIELAASPFEASARHASIG